MPVVNLPVRGQVNIPAENDLHMVTVNNPTAAQGSFTITIGENDPPISENIGSGASIAKAAGPGEAVNVTNTGQTGLTVEY